MDPKVSILWVNYNSSSFMQLAQESLKAIKDLDYSNFELIIVDNGSGDGSFAVIKDFIEKNHINNRIIQLGRNLGFTGGNNAAYAARDRDSKYIILLNNDAVPRQDSLRDLVNLMENDENLGAVQGVILNHDERSIDTAGDYITELFYAESLFQGEHPESLKKPVYITSADAAYSIFRVKAINKIPDQNNRLFDDYLFGYFDDHMLGLKLWNSGFKIKAFPIITAKHRRGSSFKKVGPLQTYLGARNLIIINEISNSRYKNLIRLLSFRQLSARFLAKISGLNVEHGSKDLPALVSRAFIDGIKIGTARRKLGERIDIYKAPILKIQPLTAFLGTLARLQLIEPHVKKELDKITAVCNT